MEILLYCYFTNTLWYRIPEMSYKHWIKKILCSHCHTHCCDWLWFAGKSKI